MGFLALQKDHTRVQMHRWSSGQGALEKAMALGQREGLIIYRTRSDTVKVSSKTRPLLYFLILLLLLQLLAYRITRNPKPRAEG